MELNREEIKQKEEEKQKERVPESHSLEVNIDCIIFLQFVKEKKMSFGCFYFF